MSVPRVLVTGASGFIATHVVQQLQQSGQYLVRGTVRSLKNPTKVNPLYKLCDKPRHELELVEADLEKDDGWVEAVKDCNYVIHTASPFPLASPKNEEEVIRPAVDGTNRVMRAVRYAGGIKRVVLTSSVASVSAGFLGGSRPYTEADWTDPKRTDILPYVKSKTLAEMAAWDFLNSLPDNEKFELSTINPALVLGPTLCGGSGSSMEIMTRLLDQKMPGLPKLNFSVVDVRDVARAHIIAMTLPEAAGNRHLLSHKRIWFHEIAKIVKQEFEPLGYRIFTFTVPKPVVALASVFDKAARSLVPSINIITEYDNSRMRNVLGIKPVDVEKTIIDMGYSMIEQGHIKKTSKYIAKANPTFK